MRAASIRYLNPLRLITRTASYDQLPGYDAHKHNGAVNGNGTPLPSYQKAIRFPTSPTVASRVRFCRSPFRIVVASIILILVLGLVAGGGYSHHLKLLKGQDQALPFDSPAADDQNHDPPAGPAGAVPPSQQDSPPTDLVWHWLDFPRLNGYYNGVRTLVSWTNWMPESTQHAANGQPKRERSFLSHPTQALAKLPLRPELFNPYPDYNSSSYLAENRPVYQCYLDDADTRPVPDIFVYPGLPQHMTMPHFGSYEELGLRHDVCFERFGRMGPYGYGYGPQEGGLGIGTRTESQGSEEIWGMQSKVNWSSMDWGKAQERCHEKNRHRFDAQQFDDLKLRKERSNDSSLNKKPVARTAYVLRAWTGFDYTAHEIITLRSMIAELALKSGGEYDVHILMHVRDDTIPIWSARQVYQKVIEDNIPQEFWGITTLWSMQQMRMYYPGPFDDNFDNPSESDIYGVYRSQHFALQWFAQEHPEYDYVWNWEMDMRYSGHHYEFHSGVVEWAKKQPRRGLWERNAKFWIPAYHGDWKNFTSFVDAETIDRGQVPVWGPVSFPNKGMLEPPAETKPPHGYFEDNFEWGVGEEADLVTFTPIFDPAKTRWVFREDITGYSRDLPVPPRRCAIVTVARLSRRLLNLMHEETYISRRSAFPEMWPPTVALHHGLKAVYIPHAIYFDRSWPYDYMNQVFNYPPSDIDDVFGYGEHNWLGSSFYYNSGFSPALWRRWLGERENNEGGAKEETDGTGRMCLRSTLHHPVKNEDLPIE